MKWLHTWGGTSFGYKDEDGNLWTHDGKHVGKFREEIVFSPSGDYLGELRNGKLIKKSNHNARSNTFAPRMTRVGYVNHIDHVGYVMIAGFEDFPSPERL